MLRQFTSRIMPLKQLFANPHIVQTPPFQRSFAWTADKAAVLLDEITSSFDAEASGADSGGCFFGTIVFLEPEKPRLGSWSLSRNQRGLEVIDGLQRLTTLTILFSVLRDLNQQDGKPPNERLLAAIATARGANARPRVTLREPDETFFHAHVRRAGATLVHPEDETLSPSQAKLIEVRKYARRMAEEYDAAQRRRLADFVLDDCCVDVLSTTDIDRAYRLFLVVNTAGKPLAKNDIIKAHLFSEIPGVRLEPASAAWDAVEKRLGGDFESLFSHIRTMHGRTSPNVIAAIKEIAARSGGAQAFIERILQPSAAVFDKIRAAHHAGSPHSKAIAASLSYLGWLKGNADWLPPAMLWWLEKGSDPAELAWFLRALERLAYALRIQGRSNGRLLSRMVAVLEAIRAGHDLRHASSSLHLAREELRTVHHNLRDLHRRHAAMAKLVLLRLNDFLAGTPQNLPMQDLTVEHLLPRKPSASGSWRALFPDPADRDRYTESLGNLVLVPKAQNDRAGNLGFTHKKDVLFGAGPPLPINDFVRRQTEWNAHQIREREAELLHHLDRIWAIGPPPSRHAEPSVDAAATAKRRKQPQASASA